MQPSNMLGQTDGRKRKKAADKNDIEPLSSPAPKAAPVEPQEPVPTPTKKVTGGPVVSDLTILEQKVAQRCYVYQAETDPYPTID